MLITDSITYNVKERGRKFRGAERNFDTASLAAMINGDNVQERVKHGDMLGYFGHWPRLKFGMATQEGGIVDGKPVSLPLALRTTELHAESDGTITHRAEFLDTEAGRIAEGLFRSKAGGFSSAIDAVRGTMPMVPRGFHGFDYVYEPNYTTNRGHRVIMDSIGTELAALFDQVMEQAAVEQSEMVLIFDSLQAQHMDALDALESVSRERDALLDRIVRMTGKDGQAVLDAVMDVQRVAPSRVLAVDPEELYRSVKGEPLAALNEPVEQGSDSSAAKDYASRRFGIRL